MKKIIFVATVFLTMLIASGVAAQAAGAREIIFYVESPAYYVDGIEKRIDATNQKVAPYLNGGEVFIPLRFLTEAIGGGITWDGATSTATVTDATGKIFAFTANSNTVKVNGENIQLAARVQIYEGRLYVPASGLASLLGRNYFFERGLIIIANEKPQVDDFIEKFTGITVVGTEERFNELVGMHDYHHWYDEVDADWGMPMPTLPMLGTAEAPIITPRGGQVAESDAGTTRRGEPTNAAVSSEPSLSPNAVAPPAMPSADAESSQSTREFSETNTQVQGVDEADIIKTDGDYIYYVRGSVIEIVKANADGTMKSMSSFTVPQLQRTNNIRFSDIFIDDGRIIAIGTSNKNDGVFTSAMVINAADRTAPVLERTVEIRGDYVSSRKIGTSVYLVANQEFWWGSIPMPIYYDTAISDAPIKPGFGEMRCLPPMKGRNVTTLAGFNIDRPDEEAFIDTFVGAGNEIYMSGTSMYIASVGNNETTIHRFAADDGKLIFVKTGKVRGSVLNQFSMDEYQTYFRIVTTVAGGGRGVRETNALYVLDNTMDIVGSIEGIAPNERIYSARFMGDRAFMVTFDIVDPLFAMDLSDPKNPVILGELKIPGYSDYLHPFGEEHLIGFGKDTVEAWNIAYDIGMKISLFDISDMNNPAELFVESIGTRGTDSPLLSNHRALMFSGSDLFAFPIAVYESDTPAVDGRMPARGTFTFAGALIYRVSVDKGFERLAEITHLAPYQNRAELHIKRLITIGNVLYAVSDRKITSHDMSKFNLIDELSF